MLAWLRRWVAGRTPRPDTFDLLVHCHYAERRWSVTLSTDWPWLHHSSTGGGALDEPLSDVLAKTFRGFYQRVQQWERMHDVQNHFADLDFLRAVHGEVRAELLHTDKESD